MDHTTPSANATLIKAIAGRPEEENALLNDAILFATQRHAGQVRKGTTRPYITHPLETMCILAGMHADTKLLIAGVLHDTLEDTATTESEIAEHFGTDVAYLVLAHTEDKSRSWKERKQTTIIQLQSAPKRVKALIMADKVSNLRSMCSDYREVGEKLWERFHAPRQELAWYYHEILNALHEMEEISEMSDIYREMKTLYQNLFEAL